MNEMSFLFITSFGFVGFFILTLVIVAGLIIGDALSGRRFRYSFLTAHTILVISVAQLVKNHQDAFSNMLWVLPLELDFIFRPLKVIFGGFSNWDFKAIFFSCLVIGGAQWYFIGQLTDYLWGKFITKPMGLKS